MEDMMKRIISEMLVEMFKTQEIKNLVAEQITFLIKDTVDRSPAMIAINEVLEDKIPALLDTRVISDVVDQAFKTEIQDFDVSHEIMTKIEVEFEDAIFSFDCSSHIEDAFGECDIQRQIAETARGQIMEALCNAQVSFG